MNASGTNVWPNTKIYSATLGTLALKGNQLENKANKYEHRARQQVKALASQMKEILPFLPKNTYPTETAQVCNCSGPEVTWGQRQESWKPPGKLACWAAENSTEANSKRPCLNRGGKLGPTPMLSSDCYMSSTAGMCARTHTSHQRLCNTGTHQVFLTITP